MLLMQALKFVVYLSILKHVLKASRAHVSSHFLTHGNQRDTKRCHSL